MAKQMQLQGLFSLVLLALSVFARAETIDVTPHICVVSEANEPCHIQVSVHVELNDFEQACLVLSSSPTPIQCFERKGNYQTTLDLELIDSTSVQLVSMKGEVLLQKAITVSRLNRNDYRIKRRFAWGI